MVLQELPLFLDILLGRSGGFDIEMISPAGEFQAVIAHALGERRKLFEGKIGPLAGEESDGSWHER